MQEKELTGIPQTERVLLGMSAAEVSAIIGDQVTIGYEMRNDPHGTFVPIMVKNPHRTQKMKIGDKTYEVFYYFTGVKQPDGEITDDELTPFIFEYNRLIGKGWNFLSRLKQSIPH
jgi:hypothetical protein